MNPALLALVLQLIEFVIKEEPAVEAELKAIFSKAEVTPADWNMLRAKILAQSFTALAPDAKLE